MQVTNTGQDCGSQVKKEKRVVRSEEGKKNSFRGKGGVGDGKAIAKGFNGLRKVRKKEKNNPITYNTIP